MWYNTTHEWKYWTQSGKDARITTYLTRTAKFSLTIILVYQNDLRSQLALRRPACVKCREQQQRHALQKQLPETAAAPRRSSQPAYMGIDSVLSVRASGCGFIPETSLFYSVYRARPNGSSARLSLPDNTTAALMRINRRAGGRGAARRIWRAGRRWRFAISQIRRRRGSRKKRQPRTKLGFFRRARWVPIIGSWRPGVGGRTDSPPLPAAGARDVPSHVCHVVRIDITAWKCGFEPPGAQSKTRLARAGISSVARPQQPCRHGSLFTDLQKD